MFGIKDKLLKSSAWPQWLAAIEVFLMSLLTGLESGWTSPSLAILLHPSSPIPVTESEGSLIASLLNIGRAVGSLLGAISVELFGSKTSVLLIGIVQVIGLICLTVADSVTWILVSRAICGTATGMFFISFPLYMGEVSNPKIRGALIGMIACGMSFGYVAGNLTGAYLSLAEFASLALVLTGLFVITFYFLPQSPHYLVLSNQLEKAKESIKWYQRDADASNELLSLQEFVKERQSMTFRNLWQEFMLPHNKIALVKVNLLYILMQLSGLYTVGFYMEIILTKAQVTIIDPAIVVVIVGFIGLIGGLYSMYASDKYGRRIVLSTSSIGLGCCLVFLSVHYQLLELGYDPVKTQWLAICTIAALETFINYGVIPIPSTILSEIFAPNIKSYSSCIVNVTSGLSAFLATQTYQLLINTMGYYVYYIYALSMFLLAIFMMIMMPETKGKSLQEIQQMLMKK